MGKTEVAITNNSIGSLENSPKISRNSNKINLALTEDVTDKILPPNVDFFLNQVAGHMYDGKSVGMLKQMDGTVLKPVIKDMCGERETRFYEELQTTKDPELLELKKFVAGYHGPKKLPFNGKEVPCITLDDITEGFKEPCIMDIKIGRRTWDPLATYDKIVNEDKKYLECKRDLGFCITGFQVYRIRDGRLCKYGKEYGKVLNKSTVKDALKIFLNSDDGLNRNLLVQLLVPLWRMQHWFRSQRKIRLYSSSLLLVYDARRLRKNAQPSHPPNPNATSDHHHHQLLLSTNPASVATPPQTSAAARANRPISFAVSPQQQHHDNGGVPLPKTGFSGQLTTEGPLLSPPSRKLDFAAYPIAAATTTAANDDSPWQQCLKKLKKTHSFSNNYDHDLQGVRSEYENLLNDLVTSDKSKQVWATVKMIDFAHVFPAENNDVDRNYLEGIENLVKILEAFLEETHPSC